MADYAKGIEHSLSKAFSVAVGKAITAAVGEPKLNLTIRSRFKKQHRGPGSVSGSEYSADTTGSAMTQNIQSFMRFRSPNAAALAAPEPQAQGMTQEQMDELRGFDDGKANPARSRHAAARQQKDELLNTPSADGNVAAPADAAAASKRASRIRTPERRRPAQDSSRPDPNGAPAPVSREPPSSPNKYDSDGFLRDSEDELGSPAQAKLPAATAEPSRLGRDSSERQMVSRDRETGRDRGRDSRERVRGVGGERSSSRGRDRLMTEQRSPGDRIERSRGVPGTPPKPVKPQIHIPIPDDIDIKEPEGQQDDESDASSTAKANRVQQWLLAQSDSFQSFQEQGSISDRRDSKTSTEVSNRKAERAERPHMERIVERSTEHSRRDLRESGDTEEVEQPRLPSRDRRQRVTDNDRVPSRKEEMFAGPLRGPVNDRTRGYAPRDGAEQPPREFLGTPPKYARQISGRERDALGKAPKPVEEAPLYDRYGRPMSGKGANRLSSQAEADPQVQDSLSLSRAYAKAQGGAQEADGSIGQVPTARQPSGAGEAEENGHAAPGGAGENRRRWQRKGGLSQDPRERGAAGEPPEPRRETRPYRKSRAEEVDNILEQTKAQYSKYLKDHAFPDSAAAVGEEQRHRRSRDGSGTRDMAPSSPFQSQEMTPRTLDKASRGGPGVNDSGALPMGGPIQGHSQVDDATVQGLKREIEVLRAELTKAQEQSRAGVGELEEQLEAVKLELLTSATFEYSLYMAKVSRGLAGSSRHMHAPGRRLLRTIMGLGTERGMEFGRQAMGMLTQMVELASEDIGAVCFWWSNSVQMRAALHRLTDADQHNHRGPHTGGSGAQWAAKVLHQQLLNLELGIFEKVLHQVWWTTLIPMLTNPAEYQDQDGAPSVASGGSEPEHRAIDLWLRALKAVEQQFPSNDVGTCSGHILVLKQQVLVACLKRVDSLLFSKILSQGRDLDLETDGFLSQALARFLDATFDGRIGSVPRIDDDALICARGPVTFQSGVTLKLAVTRWSEWAFEADIREYTPDGADSGKGLFPLLRSTADVLMMPKDMLMDPDYRNEICASLPLPAVCRILERFRPDEYCPSPVTQALLTRLNQDAATAELPAPKAHAGYVSPPETRILEEQDEYTEPGLQMDYQSEEELDETQGVKGVTKHTRFQVLAQLWKERFGRSNNSYY